MSGWDDPPYEMPIGTIDEDTTDRLLAGRIHPDDAPPGFAGVARILQAAGSLPRSGHLSREAELVAAAREVMGLRAPPGGGAGGSRTRHRRTLAGLIVTGALLGIPGLAAANALPDPAQHAVSRVLDKVGISVPGNEDHPASTGQEISNIATTTNSIGVAKGAEISNIATTTNSIGVAKGAEISTAASGGKSQAGQHGHRGNGGAPSSGTPSIGGTGRADAASNGNSTHGTTKANDKSGGRSLAGSGNATRVPSAAIEHRANPAAHP
jgi:hypothetical protein